MAREPNIYSLLGIVERFVRDVPINPGAANYKKWRTNRTEIKRTLRKIQDYLAKLDRIEPTDIITPCRRIPMKSVFDWLTPCRRVLTKYIEPSFLRLCGKIPLKQGMKRFPPK